MGFGRASILGESKFMSCVTTLGDICQAYEDAIGAYERAPPGRCYIAEIERLRHEQCQAVAQFLSMDAAASSGMSKRGNDKCSTAIVLPAIPKFRQVNMPAFFRNVVINPPVGGAAGAAAAPPTEEEEEDKSSPNTHSEATDDSDTTAPLQFAFVARFTGHEHLSHILDDIGTDPRQWVVVDGGGGGAGERTTKRPKLRQGKKSTRVNYTDTFLKWTEDAGNMLIQLGSVHGRHFTLETRPNGQYITGPDVALSPTTLNANNELIRLPADGRCMGCRRYYLSCGSGDPFVFSKRSNAKTPVFHLCDCSVRASYCTRCKVVQWATLAADQCKRSAAAATHVTYDTRVPCVMPACTGRWGLVDLFFLTPCK